MIPRRAWFWVLVLACTAMPGCVTETTVNGRPVAEGGGSATASQVRVQGGSGFWGTGSGGGGGGGGGSGTNTSAASAIASFMGTEDKVYIAPPGDGDDPSLDWSDKCANNLVALSGELLLYYSVHHGLPATLQELPPSPDKVVVSLTCPETGKPYVYNPRGYPSPPEMLEAGWEPVTLILYDATAAHKMTQHLTDGTKTWDKVKMVRYGIVADAQNNGVAKLHVVPIEDKLLDMFLKPTQMYVQPRR